MTRRVLFRWLWKSYPGWVVAVGIVSVAWIAFGCFAIYSMIKGL